MIPERHILRHMKLRLPASLATVLVAVLVSCAGNPTQPEPQPPASGTPSAEPTRSATPVPAETAAPTATETPAPEPPTVAPEAATVPEAENASATVTIVTGGEGLVAVGFDGAFGSILWTSGDGGRTWTDVTPADFASIGIASVVEYDGMLVGVGRGDTIDVDAQEAAVYLSENGTDWRKVGTTEPMIGQLIDVVATEDGLFAVGGVPGADAAGIWHSTDGETWARVGADFEHAFMWAITEGGPGLVAVGWRRNPEPDLAVWTSADAGRTWELAPDPEGFAGFEATDVAAIDDRLVMVGAALDGSNGRIWTSADGIGWEVALDDMGPAFARSVTLTPLGLVAAGGDDEQQGRAWVSTDGVTWHPLGDPVAGAYFQRAFPTEDGLLFTGATQSGTLESGIDARASIWFAPIED